MTDNKNIDNASSKSSDTSKQPSQAGRFGSITQNPQPATNEMNSTQTPTQNPRSNLQPATNETNNTQTASSKFGILPIKPDEGPWDPVTKGRAMKKSDTPIDPTDERYLHISDDEGSGSK